MEEDLLPAGWARPSQSTFFHWFDAAPSNRTDDSEVTVVRRSVCGIARYRGRSVPEINRWEADPGICEMCRDIRRARARGTAIPGQPTRTVALVPPGLPERIRAVFCEASARETDGPPFHQTLAALRPEGVTRSFLAAFLRQEAAAIGRASRTPLRWNDLRLDEVRETASVARVRIVHETMDLPFEASADASRT